MQILEKEEHYLFEKEIREKEAFEQKLVSCQFLNNKPKSTFITVVLKFILEVMKVQDTFYS